MKSRLSEWVDMAPELYFTQVDLKQPTSITDEEAIWVDQNDMRNLAFTAHPMVITGTHYNFKTVEGLLITIPINNVNMITQKLLDEDEPAP